MPASLEEVFKSFADASGTLDSRRFVKLCQDTGLFESGKFKIVDADLVFAKVKPRGSRKITFSEFEKGALAEISKKSEVSVDDLKNTILNCKGPTLNNVTKAEAVRFHDDKTLYTGVHAHGGPSTVDKGRNMVSDLSEVLDRSANDVRGVPLHLKQGSPAASPQKS